MDPLSVLASITGVLAAAAKVSSILFNVTKQSRNAPKAVEDVKLEVDSFRAILIQLQGFLLRKQAVNQSRAAWIHVDQVVIVVSGCVLVFSEVETFAKSLQSDQSIGVIDRMKWTAKASTAADLLVKVQCHKLSLNNMLTILEAQSSLEVEEAVTSLTSLAKQILSSNRLIEARLQSIEQRTIVPDTASNVEPSAQTQTRASVTSSTLRSSVLQGRQSATLNQRSSEQVSHLSVDFAFEEELGRSWVYKRARKDGESCSIFSSAARTASWSMLSGLSLSDISDISVLRLPVYAEDLANSEHYEFSGGESGMATTQPLHRLPDYLDIPSPTPSRRGKAALFLRTLGRPTTKSSPTSPMIISSPILVESTNPMAEPAPSLSLSPIESYAAPLHGASARSLEPVTMQHGSSTSTQEADSSDVGYRDSYIGESWSGMFGVPLTRSLESARTLYSLTRDSKSVALLLPVLVKKCGSIIEMHITESGIFEEYRYIDDYSSLGSPDLYSRFLLLQKIFSEHPAYGRDHVEQTGLVAGLAFPSHLYLHVLIFYLRNLPETLVPMAEHKMWDFAYYGLKNSTWKNRVYDDFPPLIAIIKKINADAGYTPHARENEILTATKGGLADCILRLPLPNRDLLIYILSLVAKILKHRTRNGSSEDQLIELFQPMILYNLRLGKDGLPTNSDPDDAHYIVSFMVYQADLLLNKVHERMVRSDDRSPVLPSND